MNFLKRLARSLGSFGFAVVLLAFLLVLTWLGTLEQVDLGLYETQKKYFDSLALIHWTDVRSFQLPWSDSAEPLFRIPSLPVPLPGVYLLLALLLLNLLIGGILRLKKDVRRLGILIAHVGIVMMLAAGFVKYRWSFEGNLALSPVAVARANPVYPPSRGDECQSYQEWEVAIFEAVPEGVVREQIIPMDQWLDLAPGSQRTFTSDALPFDLSITRWFKNCVVYPKGPMFTGDGPVIDGYVVKALPPAKEAEENTAGLYVTLAEKATGRQTDAILFREQFRRPLRPAFTFAAGGKNWVVDLRKKRFRIPFEIRVEKFTYEVHPGTTEASVYLSDVTMIEDGQERALKITMNEPLRHGGYTLYQASFGPRGVLPGEPAFPVFAVVHNPSDQWPKWSCYVIAIGLLFHFSMKLVRYVKSQHRPLVEPVKSAPPVRVEAREVARTHS